MRLHRTRCLLSLVVCAACFTAARAEDIPALGGDPALRIAYVIPSNRTPQADGVETLQSAVRFIHAWYAEEMERWGYGRMTFRYETEADGVTPKVYVVHVAEDDAYLRDGLWGRVWPSAYAAGAPVYNDGEAWLAIAEAHEELSNGDILGQGAFGGGDVMGGDADGNGRAVVSSDCLPFMGMGTLHDDTTYDGLIVPAIGPYPLVQDVSWGWYMGSTFSELGSSHLGAVAHELAHAFGLYHDFRNDERFRGNVMGIGLRGIRGCLYPDEYPSDFTRLSYVDALSLSLSRYFTDAVAAPPLSSFQTPVGESAILSIPSELPLLDALAPLATSAAPEAASRRESLPNDTMIDDAPAVATAPVLTTATEPFPTVTVTAETTQTLTDGKVRVSFTASDEAGLYLALLRRGEDTIDEMLLSGNLVETAFETPYFEEGGNFYRLWVMNVLGNATNSYITITPTFDETDNQAPRPFINAPWRQRLGERYQFSAASTEDLGGSTTGRRYEWDIDGDGVYDTSPLTVTSYSPRYPNAGVRRVRLRATDAEGAVTVSTWVTTRIIPISTGDVNCDGAVDAFDIDPFVTALVDPTAFEAQYPDCNINNADANEDGAVNAFDIDPFVVLLVGG